MNPMPLLDLIAKHESESSVTKQGVSSGYDVVVGQAFKKCPPTKLITTMTVSEVLSWQKEAVIKSGYSAAGRYQVIRKTLKSLNISSNALFNKETQDVIGVMLLFRRGWDKWVEGKLSAAEFADNLSKEWASLPFNTGQSFYAGNKHGNHSLVSRQEVMQVLTKISKG